MPTKKFGEIYIRPDSPYLWIWYYDSSEKRKQESTKTTDKTLARDILKSRISEFHRLREGIKTISDLPYKHFATQFMNHYKARYGYETTKTHQSTINEFQRFLDLVGITRLSAIDTPLIDKYITYLRTAKKNRANTCNNHRKNLIRQFNWAYKENLVPKGYNPAQESEKIEVNDAKPTGALNDDEIEAVLKAAKRKYPFYYPIYYTFIHTGLRFTELINLEWDDILYDKNVIRVKKPKSLKNPRFISMHDELASLLRRLPHKSAYVFISEEGERFPYRTRKLIRRFKKILIMVGVKNISTLHLTRHTHCSQLFAKGWSVPEVMQQMGHSRMETTQQYAHTFSPLYNPRINRLKALKG